MHVACYAIPDAGHVHAPLGMVAELVDRGHRVSFAVTDEFAGAVARVGARAVRYRTTMALAEQAARPARPAFTDDDLADLVAGLLTEAVTVLPQLTRAFADDPPDVVVYDDPTGWAGRLAAHRLGIPAVASRSTFAMGDQWSLADAHTDVRPGNPALGRVIGGVAALLARLRSDLSVEDVLLGSGAEPTLVFLPREFQYAGDTFGCRFHFVGPCVPPGAGAWSPPDDGRPTVLVSLGTVHNRRPDFYRTCVEAFAESDWRAVISVGAGTDPADLGPAPAHVELRRSVPQLDVLGHATAFVSQAGMRSSMESLHFGVPIVAVPQMSEQRANADRIDELGLGRQLGRGLTADTLRAAVYSVAQDKDIRMRVDSMRAAIRRAGGAAAAADVVTGAGGG
ncbi:macrolide family glycosyltransferase [Kutzneria buriramensis]|uniref:Demethyllactenocin mycarosyltransferase n=1 Tax=Kutzneria buriramensis TaxID=1045776 RepID=A0A3E0GZT9_9PSEU|nr:macrolide family glycosyltransferase [Kutzneria buriramensis]REH35697.1 demethyllactenocin mycarosyltransferase [Kutzneria buriramensis]